MNWAWATSLDHIWRSPALPMWLTLAAAGFFGVIVLITLLRAEKSVANGALTVITLLAIGIAVAAPLRGFGPPDGVASAEPRPAQPVTASPSGIIMHRRSRRRYRSGGLRKGTVRIRRNSGSRRFLCRRAARAVDGARRCRERPDEHDTRIAGAAPRRGARPLRTGGAGVAGARPLHANKLPCVPLAGRLSPDRCRYGRADL